jgi:2-dehydro-3-deoxyphosphogluconate aldolase/(4S)-4-hydroxy-2-oxoglutarate aldolase
MPPMNSHEATLFETLRETSLIAVLMIEEARDAIPVAEALLSGGVKAMELTLRTEAAWEALREIKRGVPEMIAGLGTILQPEQVTMAMAAGAAFGVAPGMNRRVVEAAIAAGLPFAPGVCTPSDIETALEYDRTFLKFFPCEPCGGLKYLDAIAAPYAHLGLKYLPLGGVTEQNCADYFKHPHVGAIGGSWLAPKNLIAAQNWSAITENARRAVAIKLAIRPV